MSNQGTQVYENSQNNFQLIYQKRIDDLQQKVNKYCSEYDAMMNLLPIAQNLFALKVFQKQIQGMKIKMDKFNSKSNEINRKQAQIDRNYWEKELSQINNVLLQNKSKLENISKLHAQQPVFEKQKQLLNANVEYKLRIYQEKVFNKLAQHKNCIQIQKKKQSSSNYKHMRQNIESSIRMHFQPMLSQLLRIEQEVEVNRLKIPKRELSKFHHFNHHRLLYEIMCIKDSIEDLSIKLSHKDDRQITKIQLTLQNFAKQIEQIQYQIKGSKMRYQNAFLGSFKDTVDSKQKNTMIQKQIKIDIQLLQKDIQQVHLKLKELQKFLNSDQP